MAEIDHEVVRMRLNGDDYDTITKALNISKHVISRKVREARAAGFLPPRKVGSSRSKTSDLLKSYNLTRGSVQDVLSTVEPEVKIWLLKNTPSGSTIAEFLVAIVIDAYHDDLETKTNLKNEENK